jgi:hypothetical protein
MSRRKYRNYTCRVETPPSIDFGTSMACLAMGTAGHKKANLRIAALYFQQRKVGGFFFFDTGDIDLQNFTIIVSTKTVNLKNEGRLSGPFGTSADVSDSANLPS